jgi:hypothetical protein
MGRGLAASVVFILAACGGGGGADTPAVNHAPRASLLASGAVQANGGTIEATLGGVISLDASTSTDDDHDALTYAWSIVAMPTGSTASLTPATGPLAQWRPDAMGNYTLALTVTDTKGASSTQQVSITVNNHPPNPVVATTIVAVVANAGQATVQASVGYDIVLNSGASSDADGDAITRQWSFSARPAGSTATLSSATGITAGFSPDALGDYVVVLTATDPRGAQSTYTTTVRVNNRRPVANITTNATPQALPPAPNVRVPLGTEVTLRGSGSTDADGDTLAYLWSVDTRPAGSTASLSATNVANPRFTADVEGNYILRLRVTDPAGAFSERTIGLDVGNHAPVAVIDKTRLTVLLGGSASASAALSFDDEGDALTYDWSIDARPAGSTAAIASPRAAAMSFTPDVAGTYMASVTVRDARSASIAYVTIRVLSQLANSVALAFAPDNARYSVGLDRLVAVATNPDTVRIVDPFVGTIQSVALPLAVKNFSLSPDGKLAIVLHEGYISLVDLQAATLVRTTLTGGAQTDAFITNAGLAYLIGQTGGQWVSEPVVVIDARSGVKLPVSGACCGGYPYGTQYGVYADRLNKVFYIAQGLSPSDISYFTFDPATIRITASGDSPYHGDYPIRAPLFLSGNQDLVFTGYGNFFRTDTLAYAGTLSGVTSLQSLHHSASAAEVLALQGNGTIYPASYKRFTGSLLLPEADLALPLVGGDQSYGIGIFHSGNDSHVVLVQTVTNQPRGAGARYYVITR